MDDDHYAVNRAYWDERAPAHAGSADYAVQEIIADPTRVSDVILFDLPRLGDGFDLVFTGIGALCWLPDIQRWARTVADLLRQGGSMFL